MYVLNFNMLQKMQKLGTQYVGMYHDIFDIKFDASKCASMSYY